MTTDHAVDLLSFLIVVLLGGSAVISLVCGPEAVKARRR